MTSSKKFNSCNYKPCDKCRPDCDPCDKCSFEYKPCECDCHCECKCDSKSDCNIKDNCPFGEIEPATLDLPYPEIAVSKKNKCYADILSQDFCGKTSEFTAITQYINHEIRMTTDFCKGARVLLSIAQAEMQHLNRIGKLIMLLGGESCQTLKFNTCNNCSSIPWTPNYIDYQYNLKNMLLADLKGECSAVNQYKSHIIQIKDPCVQANLERIIKDEMYHISLLKELLKDLCK